jgi:hypothetical protein
VNVNRRTVPYNWFPNSTCPLDFWESPLTFKYYMTITNFVLKNISSIFPPLRMATPPKAKTSRRNKSSQTPYKVLRKAAKKIAAQTGLLGK